MTVFRGKMLNCIGVVGIMFLPFSVCAQYAATFKSNSIEIDTRTDLREAASVERLLYDASWNGSAATARIMEGTETIAEGVSGEVDWSADTCGEYTLTLNLLSASGVVVESSTAKFRGAVHQQVSQPAIEPTCTVAGKTAAVVCSVCGKVFSGGGVTPALGHSEVTTLEAVAATCTTAGRTESTKCSRCGLTFSTSETIPALGHVEVITTAAAAATCVAAGRTKGSYCSRCGEVLSVSETIAATGHSGAITKVATVPTSSAAGTTEEISCTKCGTVLQAATTIPALGYVRNVTARQLWPYQKVAIDFEAAPNLAEAVGEDVALSLSCHSGSSTKTTTASFIIGDRSTKSGMHRIVWDMAKDGVSVNASDLVFTVSYGSKSGASDATKVNTSLSLNVAGEAALGYSPIDTDSAEVFVDGVQILSATNSGSFVWQPTTLGSHALKHVAGTNLWTKTVNVVSLATASAPSPNPPTEEDANIKIGSTIKNFATSAKGSGAITTSGSGTWTATASDDWITISIASRTAGLPLAYQVAANTGVESRTGYIYVSGNVFTITQAGVGAELETTSAAFDADGGEGSFTVVADTSASWRAQSNVDWISLANTMGTGQVAVVYTVAPWNSVSTRSGTITAAGCTFTVNQTGRLMKLSSHAVSENYQSHVLDLALNALSGVEWNIWLGAPWISVVDGGNGKGSDNIALAINENPSYLPRTGRVAVGTEELTITQMGRPTAALAFAISPTQTTGSVDGANGLITVTATPDLPWTAKSDVSWLTLLASFASGDGNGNVIYTVSPNSTMTERRGTITVSPTADSGLAAKTHAVTQPAATSVVSDSSHDFDAAGDSFDVGVTVADVVAWTVEESCSWVSIDGDTSRVGPGTVTIHASENTSVDARSASVMIAGHPFTVRQAGRTVEVEYTSKVFGTESESGTIDVHPNGNVSWTATTKDLDWIIIWAGEGCTLNDDGSVSGTGDATVEFMVTDYVGDGTPRTGTITIGDKTVYVTQRAYELSINPTGETVTGNAGQGEVGVPASVGDVWNAIATAPWITVVSGYNKGTGSGKVMFTYTENDTGAERTGKIVIAGEEYTLTQQARQMVTITATAAGGKGAFAGAGRYDLGTSVTLKATAQDGYEFLYWTLADGSTNAAASVSVVADVDKTVIANFRRIPVYLVNGESVRENTVVSFAAPADVVDAAGTTKLVCRGSSAFADKGAAFSLKVTEDVSFDWDLWTTNYWVAINQTEGGTVSGTTGWVAADAEVTFTATPAAGNSLYRWAGFDGGRGATALPSVTVRVSRPMAVSASFGLFADTLATAADAPTLTFTTGGDAAWTPVIDATAECGYSSACSGAIGAESETWMETTVEGAGVLTFNWRVDCERDDGGDVTWDRLSVFTNNVEAARIDGRTAWQTVALPVGGGDGGGGKTTVRWSFYRDDYDEASADCSNCGWVDQVIWKEAK